jgi:hypothetical protein
VGHQSLNLLNAHALTDGALHADKSHAVLIFHELADRPNPTVAKMIDIVNGALAVLERTRCLTASMISSLVNVRCSISVFTPNRALILKRPTSERSGIRLKTNYQKSRGDLMG